MKGIILAGGTGSRLQPLTLVTNKHLLPVGNKPMIMHGIYKFLDVGITDIIIVTDPTHLSEMASLLGSGQKFNCNITFRVQDKPDGIGGALKLCEDFAGGQDVIVLLGDNIFEDSLDLAIQAFIISKQDRTKKYSCVLNLKEVKDPNRFGIATIKNNVLTKITEKPINPESNLCVTGIYLYDNNIFKVIKTMPVSSRGEYEITDANNFYVKKQCADYSLLEGWWIDAGTFSSYHKANRYSLIKRL
jgi:glucose-1-phosphate thymidylyltransferase